MTKHRVGTREEWLAARMALLEREKEVTRRSDELARERQELPWVRIDKEYGFETEDGAWTLAELFDGRSQLLARGADRLQAPHGLEIPVGIVSGQRLQPGLRRVHRGGATKRHRVQLRRGAQGGNRPPPRGAARPECLRAGGRGRLPHVLVLRPGHRRAERHLAAARQAPEGRGDGFEGWPRRHDEYEDVEPIAINERS